MNFAFVVNDFERQHDFKFASFAGFAFGVDRAAHHFDEPFDYRKSYTGSDMAFRARFVELMEHFENFIGLFSRKSYPGVVHFDGKG